MHQLDLQLQQSLLRLWIIKLAQAETVPVNHGHKELNHLSKDHGSGKNRESFYFYE